jgi:hypothetical protein
MAKLVAVDGHRWAIEDSFETAKNELGLDHNETRSWHVTSASIDPATFTLVRLSSGTVMLGVIWLVIKRGGQVRGSWSAALALFAYASAFSFAYISLPAGAGAFLDRC